MCILYTRETFIVKCVQKHSNFCTGGRGEGVEPPRKLTPWPRGCPGRRVLSAERSWALCPPTTAWHSLFPPNIAGHWGRWVCRGRCCLRPPGHSPAEERLLQVLAGGKGLASEHVAHDDMWAASHEGQHGIGLEGAAAGHQAQTLQRGALAQRLEELRVGAEVGLLQPAGRERVSTTRHRQRRLLDTLRGAAGLLPCPHLTDHSP